MHGNRVDCRLGVDQLAKPYSCVDGVPLWTGIAESEWPHGAEEINVQLLKDLRSWVWRFAVREPRRSIFAIRNYRRIESRCESIADAFADSCDWRALEPSIVGFLSRIAAGPEWLTRSTSGFGSGEIVTSKFKTDRGELKGIESPTWPFRVPDIASVPYEWEAYQTEVPTTHRYWTELRGRCLKTNRSVVETFADMVERHVAACPARSVLTGLSPGGACHLKYAITNCRLLFGVDDRARGDGATSTREDWRCLRPAVARTLDAQLERLLVWVNVPWAVLQFSSVESTRLIAWLVEQASAALVRSVLERLLFDSVSAQCKVNEPKTAEPGVCSGHRVPLMDQDSFVGFSPDKWAAPFAVTANLDEEEVSFHAYHAIPSHRWTYIAEHGDLCRETGMSPVTPAVVRSVLEKLNIPDPRYGPRTHQVLAKKMTASRIAS
jgi:hypothetical protein